MLKKHFINPRAAFAVAALVAVLSSVLCSVAYANFTQTIIGNETYDVSLFGPSSDTVALTTGADVILEASASTTIAVDQEGTLTLTLSGAEFASAVPVGMLIYNDPGASGTDATLANATILAGGAVGNNSVTFGFAVANGPIDAGSLFTLSFADADFDTNGNQPVTIRGASGLATTDATVTVSTVFASTGSNASQLSGFANRIVTVMDSAIATSASRLSTTLTPAAANEADIELADRTNFENTNSGTDSETTASLGTLQATEDTNVSSTDAGGVNDVEFGPEDTITITISGNFSAASAVCLSTNNVCGEAADFAGTIDTANNQATIVGTDADAINTTAHNILLVVNGTSTIPLSTYTATTAINFTESTSLDVAAGAATALTSTTLQGVAAVNKRAVVVTPPGASDLTFVRIVNVESYSVPLFAQLTSEAGVVSDLIELAPIPAFSTRVMNSDDFNNYFNTSALAGRSSAQFTTTSLEAPRMLVVNLLRSGDILTHIDN